MVSVMHGVSTVTFGEYVHVRTYKFNGSTHMSVNMSTAIAVIIPTFVIICLGIVTLYIRIFKYKHVCCKYVYVYVCVYCKSSHVPGIYHTMCWYCDKLYIRIHKYKYVCCNYENVYSCVLQ